MNMALLTDVPDMTCQIQLSKRITRNETKFIPLFTKFILLFNEDSLIMTIAKP